MGWEIGFDEIWQRDVGYGVPATCDKPGCNAEIDRGLSYVCGGDVFGGEHGCGLFFCESHLFYGRSENAPQLCPRCMAYRPPYKHPSVDTEEWVHHKQTHESWAKWRNEVKAEIDGESK